MRLFRRLLLTGFLLTVGLGTLAAVRTPIPTLAPTPPGIVSPVPAPASTPGQHHPLRAGMLARHLVPHARMPGGWGGYGGWGGWRRFQP